MRMFKEYPLEKLLLAPQTVYLPKGAEVVTAQDTDNGLMLYALVSPAETLTDIRTFKICNTSETFYSNNTIKYIASFKTNFGIYHLIELF